MAYRYDLTNVLGGVPNSSVTSIEKLRGRVVDIILSPSHPRFEEAGGWNSVGAIIYRPINRDYSEENLETLPIAYPMKTHIRVTPVLNEIVELEKGPSESLSESASSTKTYYTEIIGIWNHPHTNIYPDITRNDGEYEVGEEFTEAADINPLNPFEGDVLLEGRHGQSIRFNGVYNENALWTTKESTGHPIIIIANGQIQTENGYETITEDINGDAASIYLTNTHTLPLASLDFPRNSYKNTPISEESYEGNQVALVSDRIILRSRTDHTLISSAKSTGILGETVNLDGNSTINLESPRINLGKDAKEQGVLGNKLQEVLTDVLEELASMGKNLVTAGLTLKSPELVSTGTDLALATASITAKLSSIVSTKTYIK